MENTNYNLIRLLSEKCRNISRLERHYVKDAEEAGCPSIDTVKQILEDDKKHAEMLQQEINQKSKEDNFN